MGIPPDQAVIPVIVRPVAGEGAFGAAQGEPVELLASLDGSRRLVRGRNGDEVVSESRLRINPRSDLDIEQLFANEALVTVRGHPAEVVAVKPYLDRGLLDYLEVALA